MNFSNLHLVLHNIVEAIIAPGIYCEGLLLNIVFIILTLVFAKIKFFEGGPYKKKWAYEMKIDVMFCVFLVLKSK